jgi:hypothetical protein
MIVQLVSTVTMGYMILLHVQLYDIFPALVIIPTMFVLGVGHFLMKSHERAEQSEKEKIRDRLVSRRSMREKVKVKVKVKVKYDVKKQEGEGGREVEGEGKEDCEVFNKYKDVMSSDNLVREMRSSGEEGVRVAEAVKHVSRRQSVQQAVIQLKRMEVEMEAIEEDRIANKMMSSFNEEACNDDDDNSSLQDEFIVSEISSNDSPTDEEEERKQKDHEDDSKIDEYLLSDVEFSDLD